MKFTLPADDLAKALAFIGGAVPSKTTIPLLESAKLETGDHGLAITANSMVLQARTVVGCQNEPGAVCVTAARLAAFANGAPKGAAIEAELADNRLKLLCGRSRASLLTLKPDEFPRMEFHGTDGFSLPVEILRRMLDFVASHRHDTGVMEGVALRARDGHLEAAATDGKRAALVRGPEHKGEFALILPPAVLPLIASLPGNATDTIEVTPSATMLRLASGNSEILSRLIDGTYPPIERVIPEDSATPIRFDAPALAEALRHAIGVVEAEGKVRAVRLAVDGGMLTVTAGREASDRFEAEIDAEGPAHAAWYQALHLRDALGSFANEGELELHASGPQRPIRLNRAGSPHDSVTLMPLMM